MSRKEYIDKCVELLVRLRYLIETYSGAGLYDINIISEDFFKHFLNLLYVYNLKNINITEQTNFPAIDLGDKQQKVAIQITSTSDSTKVKKTIKKFIEKGLYKDYAKLIILIIAQKKQFTATFDTEEKFTFNSDDDIIFIDDLAKIIRDQAPDKLKEICDFLIKEIGQAERDKIEPTIANEVRTIIDLIEYLAKNKKYSEIKQPSNPDPEGKIYKRFKDHTDFLTTQYVKLAPIYKKVKDEALKVFGIDVPRLAVTRTYLMIKSDEILNECKGNPKEAMTKLSKFFEGQISKDGREYDISAIQYYLIDELINCSVFPN